MSVIGKVITIYPRIYYIHHRQFAQTFGCSRKRGNRGVESL